MINAVNYLSQYGKQIMAANAAIKGARLFARPVHGSLWAIFDSLVMCL